MGMPPAVWRIPIPRGSEPADVLFSQLPGACELGACELGRRFWTGELTGGWVDETRPEGITELGLRVDWASVGTEPMAPSSASSLVSAMVPPQRVQVCGSRPAAAVWTSVGVSTMRRSVSQEEQRPKICTDS